MTSVGIRSAASFGRRSYRFDSHASSRSRSSIFRALRTPSFEARPQCCDDLLDILGPLQRALEWRRLAISDDELSHDLILLHRRVRFLDLLQFVGAMDRYREPPA